MIDSSVEPVAVPRRPTGKSAARSFVIHAALAAITLVTPFAVLLPAVLLHCGIRLGRRAAWLALATGVAFAALVTAFQVTIEPLPRSEYSYLAAMILGLALPALAVLPMVERGEAFGRVLLVAIVVAVGGLLLTEVGSRTLLSFSPYTEQIDGAKKSGASFADFYAKMGMPSTAIKKWTDVAVFCTPGFLVIDITLFLLLSVLVFGRLRGWRAAVEGTDLSLATPYLFRNLAFPDWLLFAFIVGGVSPLMKGAVQHVGANILTVVVFLYLVQGLAIFRSLLVTFGAGLGASLLAYAMLGVLTVVGGIAPLMLSMAGLFDSFFDFRHFMKRKDDSDESHSD
ncbi:MAG TPA: DUF2232 domain-containing protein [Thermoanaerobaculia bacterium]|nr:DUF2232 domain-containing protein [Thermoanaerobaculia bacterium]